MHTALDEAAIHTHLSTLAAPWTLNAAGHLSAEYAFATFRHALTFANAIGDLADQADHHPDLHVGWGRCTVELWTHDAGGLTAADFALAQAISECYDALP